MLRVDCSASSPTHVAEPVVLWFGARAVEVQAVMDRWYGDHQRWWKVDTVDGPYIVRLDEVSGSWELAAVVRG